MKIYLLNFKSTKIKFSNFLFWAVEIGADNRKPPVFEFSCFPSSSGCKLVQCDQESQNLTNLQNKQNNDHFYAKNKYLVNYWAQFSKIRNERFVLEKKFGNFFSWWAKIDGFKEKFVSLQEDGWKHRMVIKIEFTPGFPDCKMFPFLKGFFWTV